jgi:hypothetical protein
MLKRASTPALCAVLMLACGDPPAPTAEPAKSTAPASATSTGEASAAPSVTAAATATNEPEPQAASASAVPSGSADAKVAKTSAPTGAPTASAAPTATVSLPDEKGSETKGASFSAYMSGAGSYKAGQGGTVTAVVTPLGEYKVNQEYPFKFTLNAAPAGVSYSETVVRNVSRTEKRAAISIPFTPSSAGNHTISGVYSLSVCTASNCLIEKVPLSVTVKVE